MLIASIFTKRPDIPRLALKCNDHDDTCAALSKIYRCMNETIEHYDLKADEIIDCTVCVDDGQNIGIYDRVTNRMGEGRPNARH